MIPPYFTWAPLVTILAAITGTALVLYGRRGDPDRSRPRRDVPGLPDDGAPLECWEWDEWDRIEAFYADTANEPARGRRRPS